MSHSLSLPNNPLTFLCVYNNARHFQLCYPPPLLLHSFVDFCLFSGLMCYSRDFCTVQNVPVRSLLTKYSQDVECDRETVRCDEVLLCLGIWHRLRLHSKSIRNIWERGGEL